VPDCGNSVKRCFSLIVEIMFAKLEILCTINSGSFCSSHLETMRKYILYLASAFLLLAGCSEKKEVVLKKIEGIPEETAISVQIPIVEEATTETEKALALKAPQPGETVEADTSSSGCPGTTETQEPPQKPQQEDSRQAPRESAPSYGAPVEHAIAIFPGECLLYRMKWNQIPIGRLIIVCKQENLSSGPVYHIAALTFPEGLWTKVGYGYNRFDSFIDSKTRLPYYYYGYSASSNSNVTTRTTINQRARTLSYQTVKYKNNKLVKVKKNTVSFPDKIYDGLSAFFVLRGTASEKQRFFSVPVGITEIMQLRISFLSKEVLAFAGFGQREVYIVQSEATGDEGLFKKGKLSVAVSADDEKIPFYLKGSAPMGTGNVELVKKLTLSSNTPLDSRTLTQILLSST